MSEPARSMNDSLSAALRTVMSQHHITQAQVAAEIGYSQRYVSNRTAGVYSLTVQIIEAVAHLLEVSPERLLIHLIHAGYTPSQPVRKQQGARPHTPVQMTPGGRR